MYQTVYAAYMGFFISIHVSAAKPAFSIVSNTDFILGFVFSFCIVPLPFIKAVGDYQTAFVYRIFEGGFFFYCFNSSI